MFVSEFKFACQWAQHERSSSQTFLFHPLHASMAVKESSRPHSERSITQMFRLENLQASGRIAKLLIASLSSSPGSSGRKNTIL